MPRHPRKKAEPVGAERRYGFGRIAAAVTTIVLITSIAYLPSLRGEFILDDHFNLTENPLIRASDGPYRFWLTAEPIDYWPVFNTALWLEWRLWGANPIGYRVTNLGLHILTTLLLWAVLARLSIPGAFLATLLFAVHPVNIESVAWITQLKNLLALLFSLACFYLYLASEKGGSRGPDGPKAKLHYVLSLGLLACAVLSKGSAAVVPLLLLITLWWMRPLTRRDGVRLAPFFAICIVLVLVNVWFQSRFETDIAPAGLVERLLAAGAIVWFYLLKALVPLQLAFVYPRWDVSPEQIRWWIPLFAAVAVTAVLWRYRRNRNRPLLFAWCYFCAALLPVLGFTRVGYMEHSLVADHYQHMALIGVTSLAAATWATWRQSLSEAGRWASNAAAATLVGILALLTWQQSGLYIDSATLFGDALRKNPGSWMARNNLGAALADSGRYAKATEQLQEALRLKRDYPDAHNNLGRVLFAQGHVEEAIEQYRQALEIKPTLAAGHYNLGIALAHRGELPEAIEHYRQALQLQPDYIQARINLGNALADTEQFPAAIEQYEQALRLQPDFAEAHYNVAVALTQAGRPREAVERYEQALEIRPDYAQAHNDLGVTLVNLGRLTEAIAHFQLALRLEPNLPDARYNLEVARRMEKAPGETPDRSRDPAPQP